MLIWSVHREEEGPFRCYKAFGDDLKKKVPVDANHKLENMAVSIIRDRIANLTLNDILKNRSKLRNGVKEEMQKILSGWGIWLETCEVQDVQITSRSLFTNLQTEFREASRQEAERISANTNKTINEEALVRQAAMDKLRAENTTATTLMKQQQEAKLFQEQLKYEQKKAEAQNLKRIRDNEMYNELERKKLEFSGQSEIFEMEQQIKLEAEKQKLKQVQYQTEQMALDNELMAKNKRRQQELEIEKNQLRLQAECYTDNVLKAKVLDTTENIYKRLHISEMKVVNMSGAQNQDPAGQLLAQMMTSYNAISEGMK